MRSEVHLQQQARGGNDAGQTEISKCQIYSSLLTPSPLYNRNLYRFCCPNPTFVLITARLLNNFNELLLIA